MQNDYPHDLTVAGVISQERRGLVWAKDAVARTIENLQAALKEIECGDEYSDLRRALIQTLHRMREAHSMLCRTMDHAGEAVLTARRATPVTIRGDALLERYKMKRNGAEGVAKAREERARRDAEYLARQKERQERERQAWLNGERSE
jgi:hypothetical protein